MSEAGFEIDFSNIDQEYNNFVLETTTRYITLLKEEAQSYLVFSNAEINTSFQGISLSDQTLNDLLQQLEEAKSSEDFELAALLRDEIKIRKKRKIA